ncbi:glycosyltransferase family 4 protein [Dyella sp. C11]|uniref:glycosyltransferase family 4 protein n=1 Tax=Dyella sp. C11 TaxID=2126991 RepID=UPI0018E51410|nr:glycosyltransferase family 4 protein [Dyella sp. C11]
MLAHWPSLVDIAEAPASAGVQVSVIQMATREGRMKHNGVDYRFMPAGHAGVAGRARGVAHLLGELGADVAHVHSLGCAADVHALARELPRLPILLQDHADRVPSRWRHPRWRRWYAAAQGVAFTAPELAKPYVSAALFAPSTRIFVVPESTSRFTPGSRASAWSETGLYGDPCVVWVGHLQSGKDPLTVLEGVAQASESLPGLQLWCAFGRAPLLDQVRRRIEGDARLVDRVHLLGKVPHPHVQSLMRAADIFVSGSHAESCGYALLEAMACGVMPVVTNIPSFRALVGNVGRLWERGDASALARTMVQAAAARTSSAEVRAHFDRALSLEAVGRRWEQAYQELSTARMGAAS